MAPILEDIYRYPVKGLSGEKLDLAAIRAGETISGDRMFALGRPGLDFDIDNPEWRPKTNFLALVRDARLAELETVFEDISGTLTVSQHGNELLCADLGTGNGRAATEAFFESFMSNEMVGRPTLLRAEGHSFSDLDSKVLSLINLETVRALEAHTGAPVHPLRFRGNLYISELDARAEEKWEGRTITIGDVRFEVVVRTRRCAATNVNPESAARDMNLPATLQRNWGHADLGVYLRALSDGNIRPGDRVELE